MPKAIAVKSRTVKLPDGQTETVTEHCEGCYRVAIDDVDFGQVKKRVDGWEAQIRNRMSGDLLRCAGVWSSLSKAVEEIVQIRVSKAVVVIASRSGRSIYAAS